MTFPSVTGAPPKSAIVVVVKVTSAVTSPDKVAGLGSICRVVVAVGNTGGTAETMPATTKPIATATHVLHVFIVFSPFNVRLPISNASRVFDEGSRIVHLVLRSILLRA
jgi:hypothetical protein